MADSKPISLEGRWCEATHSVCIETVDAFLIAVGYSVAQLEASPGIRPDLPGEVRPSDIDTILVGGQEYQRFAKEDGRLTTSGLEAFQKALAESVKLGRTNVERERVVLSKILLMMSPEMKQNLLSLEGVSMALASHNVFVIWPFLIRAEKPPGAANGLSIFKSLLTGVQTGEYSNYAKWVVYFRQGCKEFAATFDSAEHPGFIKTSTLCSMCFLNGVALGDNRAAFQFLLDKVLASIENVHELAAPEVLASQFQQFLRNSNHQPAPEAALAYAAPVDASRAPKEKPQTKTCIGKGCGGKKFSARLAKHTMCSPCWGAHMREERAKKAGTPQALVAPAQPVTASVPAPPAPPSNEWLASLSTDMQETLATMSFQGDASQLMAKCDVLDDDAVEFDEDADEFGNSHVTSMVLMKAVEDNDVGSEESAGYESPVPLGRPPRVGVPSAASTMQLSGRQPRVRGCMEGDELTSPRQLCGQQPCVGVSTAGDDVKSAFLYS